MARIRPVATPSEGCRVDRRRVTGRAVFERETVHVHDLSTADRDFPKAVSTQDATAIGPRWRPHAPGGRSDRGHSDPPHGGASVLGQADRAPRDLRRPGRDRHREHAAVRGGAGADARADRGAGAADGDLRGAWASSVSSPGELEPVFQAMLANAMRICEAKFGIMFEHSDGVRFAALVVTTVYRRRLPSIVGANRICRRPDTGLGRVARTKQPAHITDVRERTRVRGKAIQTASLPSN